MVIFTAKILDKLDTTIDLYTKKNQDKIFKDALFKVSQLSHWEITIGTISIDL